MPRSMNALCMLLVMLSACTRGTPTQTASPDASNTPLPPPTTSVPLESPDAEVGTDDGTWDRISVPGTALRLINGWSGGYLLVTREQTGSRRELHLWSIGGHGEARRAFGDDGTAIFAASGDDTPLEVAGTERRTSDDSVIVFTASTGGAVAHRIDADGRIDRTFRERQGTGFEVEGATEPQMTLVAGGAIRACWTDRSGEQPSLGMWALRADGSRDTSFGDEGTRAQVLPGAYACAGIDADAYGSMVLAATHHDRNASTGATKLDVELIRLSPDGQRDGGFASESLAAPDRSYDAQQVRIGRDGSILVAGVVTPVPRDDGSPGASTQELFVARADASGRWVRQFGDEGVATFPFDEPGQPARVTSLDPAGQRLFVGIDQPGRDRRGRATHHPSVRALDAVTGDAYPQLDANGLLHVPFVVVRALVDGDNGILLFGTRDPERGARAILERYPLG